MRVRETVLRGRWLAVVALAALFGACAAPRTVPTYFENIYGGLRGSDYRSAAPDGVVGAGTLPMLQQYNAERARAVLAYLAAHADAMAKIPPAAVEPVPPQ